MGGMKWCCKLHISSLTTRRMAWTYPGWSYLAATIPPSCLNINVNISLDLWMLTSTPIHCRSEFLFRQRRSISLQGCSEWRLRHRDPTRERLLKTSCNCFEEESHTIVTNGREHGRNGHLLDQRGMDVDILEADCYLPELTEYYNWTLYCCLNILNWSLPSENWDGHLIARSTSRGDDARGFELFH